MTIFRNISYLSVAQLLSSVFGFITLTILSRALGPANFGILGFGTAVLGFLGILVTLGSDHFGAREIAQSKNDAGTVTTQLLILRFLLAGLAYCILVIFDFITNRGVLESHVLLIQGLGVFVTAFTLDYLFQGLRRMDWIAFRQIGTATLVLICVSLMVDQPEDLITATWIYIVSGGFVIIVIFFRGFYLIRPQITSFPKNRWRIILIALLPIAISSAMQTFILNTDLVMLGIMRTHEEVGLYTAAVRIGMLTLIPAGLVAAALFPELAKHSENSEKRNASVRQYTLILMLLGVPLPCVILLQPNHILEIVFGSAFLASANVLSIMMASSLIIHLRMILDTPLIAWNFERMHMKICLIGAFTNVLLNAALIPKFGITGAVSASLLSQMLMTVGFFRIYRLQIGKLQLSPILRVFLSAGLSYLLTLIALYNFLPNDLSDIVQIFCTSTVFSLCYLVFGYSLVWRHF